MENHYPYILMDFRLAPYFDYIGGATLDGSRSHKKEVIVYVLKTCRINDRAGVVMVGDRKYNIEGARQLGLDTIGMTYSEKVPGDFRNPSSKISHKDVLF